MKQEALAISLGDEWTQRRILLLEQKEEVDAHTLSQVARALGVTEEAIKNFSDDTAINIISNTFHDQAVNMNYQCTFNPLEKYIDAMEDNKKLYERLLLAEKEKVAMLEKIISAGK